MQLHIFQFNRSTFSLLFINYPFMLFVSILTTLQALRFFFMFNMF